MATLYISPTAGAAGAVFAFAKRSQWQQTLCALEDVWPREIRAAWKMKREDRGSGQGDRL